MEDLSRLKVYHVLGEKPFELKYLTTSDTVASALSTLKMYKISSAPVLQDDVIVGVVDVLDLALFCVGKIGVPEISQQTKLTQLSQFLQKPSFHVIGISGRNRLQSIDYEAPLKHLFRCLESEHRIFVHNEDAGGLVGLITQSSLLTWVQENKKSFEKILRKTVKEQFPPRKLYTISESETVADALAEIGRKLVLGLAVVDQEGKLIGNISASDLKQINFESPDTLLVDLQQTVKEFLYIRDVDETRKSSKSKKPISIYDNRTVEEVLDIVCSKKNHRVFVTDLQSKPLNVVSLSDVISSLIPCLP